MWIQSQYEDIPSVVNEEVDDAYPKGCSVLVLKDKDYGIYFNTDLSGNPDEHYRQVCKEETKGWLSGNLYLKHVF